MRESTLKKVLPMSITQNQLNKIFEEVNSLISVDRAADYGDAQNMHSAIGRAWAEHIGSEVESYQVAAMMADLKMRRLCHNPAKRDSWIDAIAYLVLGLAMAENKIEMR